MPLSFRPRFAILFLAMASFCPQVRSARVLLAAQSSGVPATAASSGERPNADPREFFVVDAVLILYYFVVYSRRLGRLPRAIGFSFRLLGAQQNQAGS
jgi:hypothetical protein